MRACTFAGAFGSSAILSVLVFAGCGGGGSEAPPAETPASAGQKAEADPKAPSGEAASPEPSGPDAPTGVASATPDAPPANLGAGDSRTMDSITGLVKAHRKEARECYEKALKQIPGLKGDLVIHFVLKPSGEVKQAELNEQRSTIREASVSTCVIDVLRKIDFPKSSKGLESVVNYPFNFNP